MSRTGVVCVWLVVAGLVPPGTATASSACARAVLSDWLDDGQVGRLYDLPCYAEAIEAIPTDLRDYTDAEQVISRAFHAATRGVTPLNAVEPTAVTALRQRARAYGGGIHGAPAGGAATEIDSVDASPIPIPLIVLGGMSLVLLGAGGVGYISRRRRDLDSG